MKKIYYKIKNSKTTKKLRMVLLSDLHDNVYPELADTVAALKPDVIAIPGDLTSRLDLLEGEYAETDRVDVTHSFAFSLLKRLSDIAPTYYSLGNHELCGHYYKKNVGLSIHPENLELIRESGAVLLDNSFICAGGLRIGGLTSGMTNADLTPDLSVIDGLEKGEGLSILLCHHPEYYEKYLKSRNIDVILSGHAHGGQIRLFGRGLYAPGQGILPSHAGGLYDGRLAVGRGLANTAFVPRFFNPREIVIVDVEK